MINHFLITFFLSTVYLGSCQSEQIPPDVIARFDQREAIWGGNTYFNKDDTVFVGKKRPYPKRNPTDSKLMNLPDSLGLLVRNTIIESFDDTRKRELKHIKQYFGVNIYINKRGIIQELEYEIPKKFAANYPKISINENDFINIEQNVKGMQLILPEWWQEVGYARIVFFIPFSKL